MCWIRKCRNHYLQCCVRFSFDSLRTRDSSVSSSLPSKYSAIRIFLVNSIMSSFSSCMFGFVGMGVYFKPFSNNFITLSFSFLDDKLTIWISDLIATCSGFVDCPGTKNHLISYLFHTHYYFCKHFWKPVFGIFPVWFDWYSGYWFLSWSGRLLFLYVVSCCG